MQPVQLVAAPIGDETAKAPALKFENAPSEMVLKAYALETGRTLLFAPDAPKANITLTSQTSLNRHEYLQAIQTVLVMNNIALLPVGDKFLKVVPAVNVRQRAIETLFQEPADGFHDEVGEMISQMVQLKYISMDEAKTTIDSFKSTSGLIQLFERTGSILITDTAENVNRMREIIQFIDQPHVVREEVNVRAIRYAKAATIKQRLEEIIAESLKAQQGSKESPSAKMSGSPGMGRTTTPLPLPVPGVVVRATPPASVTPASSPIIEALMADAERGMIRGKVQIIADERTNMLIIITQPENMSFFDRIISVLDVETAPDIDVKVYRLEYADATEVADMLNQLIGNVKNDQTKGTGATGGAPGDKTPVRSLSLADAAAARAASAAPAAAPTTASEATQSKIGELSKDNIKVLANKRTNAVILMASKSDIKTLLAIVVDMDIMLSQVLIETVILDVSLSSSLSTGIDWIQQKATQKIGGAFPQPFYTTGSGGGGGQAPVSVNNLASNLISTTASGIQYFLSMPNISVNAVISAASSDGRTKILSSPVLLTQDNKDATIKSTQSQYLYNGTTVSGYNASGQALTQVNTQQKDIGLTVKVTPRINVKGMVVLHVDETFDDIGPSQSIPDGSGGNSSWPTVVSRQITADIAVKNGETVILGGLIRNSHSSSNTKIPLLGDIPFIGPYLFGSTSTSDDRSELLVFLTPYVLDNAESREAEARRRKDYLDIKGMWTKGWSDSKLADETIVQKLNREKAERAREREEKKSEESSSTTTAPAIPTFGTVSSTVTTNALRPVDVTNPDVMNALHGLMEEDKAITLTTNSLSPNTATGVTLPPPANGPVR
jgi:general secretion pathway protein D